MITMNHPRQTVTDIAIRMAMRKEKGIGGYLTNLTGRYTEMIKQIATLLAYIGITALIVWAGVIIKRLIWKRTDKYGARY